jgi:4-amino-4-deoxy-L-arabinose transferase-like glycosyltransferase
MPDPQLRTRWVRFLDRNKIGIGLSLLITLVVAALWIWAFNTHSFDRRDAYDYAQLSRQVYRGDGLTSLQIFPRHVPYFQRLGILSSGTWPNLYRNPLLTLTGAGFQLFFENVIVAMVIQSGFWYLASLPLLFFLARQLTNLKVAVLSTLFYAADPVVLLYSYSGMTESLGTFLLLLLVLLFVWKTSRPWKWFLVGIVAVLAYLARAQFVVLIPLILVYVWFNQARTARLPAIVLIFTGMLFAFLPLAMRNLQVTANPLFSFTTTRNLVLDAVPGHSDLEMQLNAPVDLFPILRTFGDEIMAKFFHNVVANILSLPYWANTFRRMAVFLPPLAILGVIHTPSTAHKRYNLFKWATPILILSTIFVISLTVYSVRSYVMFRPLVTLIAITELLLLIERFVPSPYLRNALLGVLVLLAAYQLLVTLSDHQAIPAPISAFDQKAYQIVDRKTGPEALIASDISEQVSLLADRRALRLPADPSELLQIDRDYISVDYVLLSKNLLESNAAEDESGYHETYSDYLAFASSPAFLRVFQLDERLPNGSVLYRKVNGN